MSVGEIFRHLRFQWYNPVSMQLEPLSMGGVSFLLRSKAGVGEYDVWVDITPYNATFSTKQSVKNLRRAFSNGVIPFTSLNINRDEQLNDQLFRHFLEESKSPPMPSTVYAIIANVLVYNSIAEASRLRHKEQNANSKAHYE